MARVLRMPDVGADSDEGVLASWLVEESARFDAAQTIAYVETLDELFSVEAGRPGVLLRALVAPGTPVPSGTPIGVLGEIWEKVHDVNALLIELGVGYLAPPPPGGAPPLSTGRPGGRRSSAVEDGVPRGGARTAAVQDGASVSRSRHFRIEMPVGRAAHSADALSPDVPDVVADRMPALAQEYLTVPASDPGAPVEPADSASSQHHYLRTTVRVDRLAAISADLERAGTPESSLIDLVGRAVAGAHRHVPQLGAARLETESAGTPGIPVTHPGRFGVQEAAAAVPQGQVAALAVGALRDEPVVDGASVVVGKVITLTLSMKPGRVDDAPAARWLGVLVALLERPDWMAE